MSRVDLDFVTAWAKLERACHTKRTRCRAACGCPILRELSLIAHSADVAAVFRALLEIPVVARTLAALLCRTALSDADIDRLVALAALHDLGKVNAGFQRRRGAAPGLRAGHIEPLVSLIERRHGHVQRSLWGPGGLERLDNVLSTDALGCAPWIASLAHHGDLPEARQVDPRLWQGGRGCDPVVACRALTDAVLVWCPSAGPAESIAWTHPFGHAFAGLVTLADWLGSDETVFPLGEPEGLARYAWSLEEARKLVRSRHLAPEAAFHRAQSLPKSAAALTGFAVPAASQEAMLRLPAPPPLGRTCLLEGETGSGKTEAALLHFVDLFRRGDVGGMYFALPTRAAAAQIHGRIKTRLGVMLGDPPPVVLAVPGYLPSHDNAASLPTDDPLWTEGDALPARDQLWSSERPKRYLASWVAVGTIDQLLLGGIRIRHATLRSAMMLRLLLVIDEVHANDTYMTALLRNVLVQHRNAGGHALLMSATLGSHARASLLKVDGRVQPPPQDDAAATAYPALWSDGSNAPIWSQLAADQAQRPVRVTLEEDWRDDGAVVGHALQAARAGAHVLVIRNTVRSVVATFQALEALAPDLLLHVAGTYAPVRAPHHARFAPEDRLLLDAALEAALGKQATRAAGRILVASQTAEQSLDIDADLLITDLCPADVLLQRIGRLHRHNRARPPGFETAQCVVLAPDEAALAGGLRHDGATSGQAALGLGLVYPNLVGILATRLALELAETILIPRDNRALVEAATHPQALLALATRRGGAWLAHWGVQLGVCGAQAQAAADACIEWDKPVCAHPSRADTKLVVRLGLDDRSFDLPSGTIGPFGTGISRLSVPGRWLRGVPYEVALIIRTDTRGSLSLGVDSTALVYDRFGLRPA